MARRAVILDRDGTLNVDYGYVFRAEHWEFTERAIEGLRLLSDSGFALIVVSNQSGIARGLYTDQDVECLHAFVRDHLSQAGIPLAAFAYCPHGEWDGCECRKPKTGLVPNLERQFGTRIDYPNSWTVGDKPSDVGFGRTLGTKTALVRSRYWSDGDLVSGPNLIVDNLYGAAIRIVADR